MDISAFGSFTTDLLDAAQRQGQRLYKRASNTILAQDFNQRVFAEVARKSTDLDVRDTDGSSDESSDEGWDEVVESPRVSGTVSSLNQQTFFAKLNSCQIAPANLPIFNSSNRAQQLRYKISQKSIETVCEAVGISRDYAEWALKLFSLEASRNIGWASNCKSVADVVRTIKHRFPILTDMQDAYLDGRRQNMTHPKELYAAPRPIQTDTPGLEFDRTSQIGVSASLDDLPILTDETIRAYIARQNGGLLVSSEGSEIFNRDLHGEMEIVFEGVSRVSDKSKLERVQVIDADGIHDLPVEDD